MKFSNCLAGQFLISDHHNSHQQVSLPPLKRSAYQASEGTVLPNFFFFIFPDALGTSFSFIAHWLQLRQITLISDFLTLRQINFVKSVSFLAFVISLGKN